MPPKKISVEESAKEIKKNVAGLKNCAICHMGRVQGDNELETFGGYWKLNKDLFFHYFCLLFSKNAKQKGKQEDGVRGFLINDIKWVLKEYKSKKCCYCQKTEATSICHHAQCTKRFHYTCGMQRGGKVQFHTSRSFCDDQRHWPKSNHKLKHKEDRKCMAGCLNEVEKKDPCIISPCCQRIYHFDCVQSMALSYGKAHLNCPNCREKNKFCEEALNQGVYIPEKDAEWESPNQESFYNFQAMGELYNSCDANPCACTKGPKFNLAGSRFEIIRCDNCGSSAVHIFCGKLMRKAPYFICENHENALEEMEKRNSEIKMRLKEENISEDDDSWIDDSHLIKPGFSPLTAKKRESTSPPPKPGLVKIKKPKLTPKRSPENTPLKNLPEPIQTDKNSPNDNSNKVRSSLPSPSKMISSAGRTAKITEVIIDSDSDDSFEEPISANSNSLTDSTIVRTPFRLFNPHTQESFIMKVAPLPPLPYFELNPSLEGLNLQVHENMQIYYQNQDSVKSSKIEKEQFPQIGSVFSFDELEQQQQVGNDQVPRAAPSKRNDIIDLCDSD